MRARHVPALAALLAGAWLAAPNASRRRVRHDLRDLIGRTRAALHGLPTDVEVEHARLRRRFALALDGTAAADPLAEEAEPV